MRKIEISFECKEYFEKQNSRVEKKFYQLVEVLVTIKVVPNKVAKKLVGTEFYELRIKAGNEYRVILFTYSQQNLIESQSIILLHAFLKKSKKDYVKAIRESRKILENLIDEEE